MKSLPVKAKGSQPGRSRATLQTWVLLGLSAFFSILALLLSVLKGPNLPWLPVHIHSVLTADYSQDPQGQPIAQVQLNLIYEFLKDLTSNRGQANGDDPDERYAEVIEELLTPVPTVTPMPGATVFVPTAQPGASQTPALPAEFTATLLPTELASLTHTATTTLLPSPTSTGTLVYPTATNPIPSPTRTRPPAATSTQLPPTQPAPTATPSPTQPPPTQPPPTEPPYPPPYP
jgi:hypothetical protein